MATSWWLLILGPAVVAAIIIFLEDRWPDDWHKGG